MSSPLVSIIVPCYKQGEYLAETLESVYAQTYSNWECIIVNDGSPDNTAEIANRYCQKDSRYKYLYQDNAGLSAARNAGIANTNGYYILPLDADDLIAKEYIEFAVKYFESNPSCKLVYCKARMFGLKNEDWYLTEYNYDSLLWSNCIFCSALYKREDYLATNGYNTNMVFGLEDWDFWLSLLKRDDQVHRLDSIMFFYRIKQKSMSADLVYHNIEAKKTIVKNHWDIYESYCDQIISIMSSRNYLAQKVDAIEKSTSYQVGRIIVRPFGIVKRKIMALLK